MFQSYSVFFSTSTASKAVAQRGAHVRFLATTFFGLLIAAIASPAFGQTISNNPSSTDLPSGEASSVPTTLYTPDCVNRPQEDGLYQYGFDSTSDDNRYTLDFDGDDLRWWYPQADPTVDPPSNVYPYDAALCVWKNPSPSSSEVVFYSGGEFMVSSDNPISGDYGNITGFLYQADDDCDDPIVLIDSNTGLPFSTADSTVNCIEDIPATCLPYVEASRGQILCHTLGASRGNTALPCVATAAAGNSVGPDAAIVLGTNLTNPDDRKYFIPTGAGLSFSYSEANGTSQVVGQVAEVGNPNAILNVYVYFDGGMSGADWPGGFKADAGCMVTDDISDSWLIYIMSQGVISYLEGAGDLDGTTQLTLAHNPVANPTTGLHYFGFQVGDMANDVNCSYGAGGWFSFVGTYDGVAFDGNGDLFLDLSCPPGLGDPCPDNAPADHQLSEGEFDGAIKATYTYQVVDSACTPVEIVTFTQRIARWDTIAPTLSAYPADTTVSCFSLIPPVDILTATDNCPGEVTVTFTEQIPEIALGVLDSTGAGCYTLQRSWQAMDSCGKATSHIQTITINDSIPPVITFDCADDVTLEVDSMCAVVTDTTMAGAGASTFTVSDNCVLASSSLTYTDVIPDSTYVSEGCFVIKRTWEATATDDCGNTSSETCTQTITVEDNIVPEITFDCADDITIQVGSDDCTTNTDTTLAGAGSTSFSVWENCDLSSETLTYSDVIPDSTNIGTGCYVIKRTWFASATDACGNTAMDMCTQTITVEDNTAPEVTLTCALDVTLNVDGICGVNTDTTSAGAGASTYTVDENCPNSTSTLTYSDSIPDDTNDGAGCYVILREWIASATDECGNFGADTCVQVITVEDNTAPVVTLTCALNVTLNVDDACYVNTDTTSTGAGASTYTVDENCPNSTSTLTYSDSIPDDTNDGAGCYVILREWIASATDECGNMGADTCVQVITVEDDIDPVVTLGCPDSITLYVDSTCWVNTDTTAAGAGSYDSYGILWNCSPGSISVTYSDSIPDDTNIGAGCYIILREWILSATDECGNMGADTCVQTITIEDHIAPVWEDYTIYEFVSCDEILDPTDPTQVPITATDNCSGVRYEIEAHQMSGGCPGTYMRIWTAIDTCGNESVVTEQYLQLYDSIAPVPVLTCPDDAVLVADDMCDADSDTSITGVPDYVITDNCDSAPWDSLSLDYSDADTTTLCGNTYEFTRTWSLYVRDLCENDTVVYCSQTITLIDETPPFVTDAMDTTVDCDGMGNEADLNAWLNDNAGATATDNCGDVTWYNNYECAIEEGDFKVYNQGAGSNAGYGDSGSSPASDYLDANFASVFPEGITTGCAGGNKLVFTTADAVDEYLPCTGSAQALVLTASTHDPTAAAQDSTCFDNALVTHLMVAKLNVAFDAADADFSASGEPISSLIRTGGPLAGKSIAQIIALGDKVLGGCSTEYTANQMRAALRDFNRDFELGTVSLGKFRLPGCETSVSLSDDCAETGSVTVTFTAVDECENEASTDATFTIQDTVPPVIVLAPTDTIHCDQWVCDIDSLVAWGFVSASDTCGDVTLTAECAPSSAGCSGSYIVTYTAEDECGLTSTDQHVIFLTDSVPPTVSIQCPSDTLLYVDAGCAADTTTSSTGMAAADYDDNCALKDSSLTYSDAITAYTAAGCYTITRTWMATAVDSCNNTSTASCAQVIQVADTTDPAITLTCPNDTLLFVDAGCGADTTTSSTGMAMTLTTDNCSVKDSSLTYSDAITAYTAAGCYTITRTWMATAVDSCDNTSTASCAQVIQVADTTDPAITLTCPNDTLLFVDAGCGADTTTSSTGMAMTLTTDNCSVKDSSLTYSDAITAYTAAGCYTITRTWMATAVDSCDNTSTASCAQVIQVADTTDPAITLTCPNDTLLFVDAGCGADTTTSSTGMAMTLTTDNCSVKDSSLTYSDAITAYTAAGCYTITRTWMATAVDSCDNTSTASCAQVIQVADTTDPAITLTCPNDTLLFVDAGCGADTTTSSTGMAMTLTTDNCSVKDSSLTYSDAITAYTAAGCYTITRTWMATAVDSCDNTSTASCAQVIQVADTTDPAITLTCPNDTLLFVDAGCGADTTTSSTGMAMTLTTDNCSVKDSSLTYSDAITAYTAAGCYTITRTWMATAVDSCDNTSTASCAQVIQVADTTDPAITLTCPNDTLLFVDAGCGADTTTSSTGMAMTLTTDNCSVKDSSLTYSDAITAYTAAGCYTITRTWMATAVDSCDNTSTASCAQVIQVADTTDPAITLTCPNDTLLFVDAGCGADTTTSSTGMAMTLTTDNCSVKDSSLTYSDAITAYTAAGCYTITRTWMATAVDSCDNTSTASCAQVIQVADTTDPAITLTCPNDTLLYAAAGCAADTTTSSTGMAMTLTTDNCSVKDSSLTYSDAITAYTAAGCYTITRTWMATAVDSCDNTSTASCAQVIQVADTTDPAITLTCPNDTLLYAAAGCAADTTTSSTGMAMTLTTDNCSVKDSSLTYSDAITAYTAAGCYTITRTWMATAVDSCDNTSTASCAQVIQVADTTDPAITLTCPNDTLLFVDAGCAADTTTSSAGMAMTLTTDNCSVKDSSLTYSDAITAYTAAGCYTITRTWMATAVDSCDNTSTASCAQVIQVADTTDPAITLTCPSDTMLYVADTGCDADTTTSSTGMAMTLTTDNCSVKDSSLTYSDAITAYTAAGCYTITRTWMATAVDSCDNMSTSSCNQTIQVIDTISPTLTVTGSDSVTVYLDEMCEVDLSVDSVGGVTWDADDNCTLDTVIVSNPVDGEITKICPCTSDTLECEEPDFRTQTMGGWGTNCNGNNPGCYRDANFDAAFPSGVTIGCAGGNTHTFTTSNAVAVYLPCGGTPGVLANSGVNGTCEGNTLSGQLLAAKLSLGFDAYDPDFSGADVGIDQLYSTNPGPCFGMTIVEIVALADSVIGDCKSGNASGLNNLLTDFNETYVGGLISNDGWAIEGCEDGYYIVTDCDTLEQGSYMFERELTVTATDSCGNHSSVTHTQIITVLDTLGPQFTETCGLTNGGSASVCCEDWNGDVDWQSSVTCNEISAVDNCDTEVYITYTDDFDGDFAPNPYVTSYCHAYQPEEFEDDETCTGHDPHALRMFNVPGIGTEMYESTAFPGVVENNSDGTWSLTQEVFSMDGSGGGWIIQVTYGVAMDWDEWTEQDGFHTFKLDCGELDDDHDNWDYRILESGIMIGTGTYHGDTLEVYHAPSNELFGFQIGLGASGQNNNYGYGAWLYYSGTINGTNVNGTGDIFGDLDCCLPWSVTRTWTALDDCENGTTFSYMVNVNGANETDCPDTPGGDVNLGGSSADDHGPVVIGGAGDLTTGKTPIRVTNLQPNPTNDWSMLGFTVTENMRLRVDMYSMDGALIAELYDGLAAPNVNHTLDIPAQDLDAGMYQIRLSSSDYLVVKKLLVSQ